MVLALIALNEVRIRATSNKSNLHT